MQIVNVHLCRSDHESAMVSARRWNGLIATGIAVEIALMLFIAYTPLGNALFGTAPIDRQAWMVMLPFAVAMLAAEEARKWTVRAARRHGWPSSVTVAQPAPASPLASAPPRRSRR